MTTARPKGRRTHPPEDGPPHHFDVYDGLWQRRTLADQLSFLTGVLR